MPSEQSIFNCKLCGECCKGYGGTYVTPQDIEAISRFIKTDPQRFVADYCQMSSNRPVLAQADSGYCIFWDRLCTIHPVKPRMCREWPYIQSVLHACENWHMMAGSCPGMATDVPDGVITAQVRRHRQGI